MDNNLQNNLPDQVSENARGQQYVVLKTKDGQKVSQTIIVDIDEDDFEEVIAEELEPKMKDMKLLKN